MGNGFDFCSPPIKKTGNLAPHPFEAIRRELAVECRSTKPRIPQADRLVNRINATLKADTVRSRVYITLGGMLEALAAYPKRFNTGRKSGALGLITPLLAA